MGPAPDKTTKTSKRLGDLPRLLAAEATALAASTALTTQPRCTCPLSHNITQSTYIHTRDTATNPLLCLTAYVDDIQNAVYVLSLVVLPLSPCLGSVFLPPVSASPRVDAGCDALPATTVHRPHIVHAVTSLTRRPVVPLVSIHSLSTILFSTKPLRRSGLLARDGNNLLCHGSPCANLMQPSVQQPRLVRRLHHTFDDHQEHHCSLCEFYSPRYPRSPHLVASR